LNARLARGALLFFLRTSTTLKALLDAELLLLVAF
jgi:hypothetical protein